MIQLKETNQTQSPGELNITYYTMNPAATVIVIIFVV